MSARTVLQLPYPPSVNHYWRRVGCRTLISREGRRFRREVVARLAASRLCPLTGRLVVRVTVFPPDNHRRDLDNLQKALLDALEKAGVFNDDGQIDRLEVQRGAVVPGGEVMVEIEECG